MSFRADFYEALTWLALEGIYTRNIEYEPNRERHNCQSLCKHATICHKPHQYKRLIYTIPDFLVDTTSSNFLHVCYWDSKETSHAKFWRTVSELCDLKRYIPKSTSTCVVFEAEFSGNEYRAAGWYPDFLRSFRELFDECVLFNHQKLQADLSRAESLRVTGTDKIHAALRSIKTDLGSLAPLRASIRTPLTPTAFPKNAKLDLWTSERLFCSKIQLHTHLSNNFERLRNAMLQIALVSLLFPELGSCDAIVRTLEAWTIEVKDPNHLKVLKALHRLPIEDRNGQFAFLIKHIEEGMAGETVAHPSEDLELFLAARKANTLGVNHEALSEALDRTRTLFAASAQVLEALEAIKSAPSVKDITKLRQASAKALWAQYTSVTPSYEYNQFAEMLIEATGLGTYPLVTAINNSDATLKATRNDIRGIYSNRRPIKGAPRYALLLRAIARLIPKDLDTQNLRTSYLLRKTHRIIGPQSAINPLEELVRAIFKKCRWADGVSVLEDEEIPTLVTDCSQSDQAGNWRVSLCVRRADQLIPVFISGMKAPADCGHKTREFCAHLSMARYRLSADGLKSNQVKQGIAVLEGGYGPEEKQAFQLAGFEVCTLATVTQSLANLGLITRTNGA